MLVPRNSSRIAPSLEFSDVKLAVSRPEPPGCPGGGGGGGGGAGGGLAGGGGGGGAVGGCWLHATATPTAMTAATTRIAFMACLLRQTVPQVRASSSESETRVGHRRHSGHSCCRRCRGLGVVRR